jgi:hypothetical protein
VQRKGFGRPCEKLGWGGMIGVKDVGNSGERTDLLSVEAVAESLLD